MPQMRVTANVTITAGERSRSLVAGTLVDPDEVVVPARTEKGGVKVAAHTLRDVLGVYLVTDQPAVVKSTPASPPVKPATEE
jgi:hypothetical protein